MKKLENKVAVVTGSNSGIGLSTAKLFALQGAKVAITGRDEESLRGAATEIGQDAIGIQSDVLDLNSITAAYEKVTANFGKIDVLVVNAGVAVTSPLANFTEQLFDQISDINFKGAFFSMQLALP